MGRFEVKCSWRSREDVTEIDMDNMSETVNEDIPVMSVLNLKEIADQGVACHTLNKILLSFQEELTERAFIELSQVLKVSHAFLQRIHAQSVRQEF